MTMRADSTFEIVCPTCGEPWATALHFCPPPVAPGPDPAETERALERAVVEAAVAWFYAGGVPALDDAVADLVDFREARS